MPPALGNNNAPAKNSGKTKVNNIKTAKNPDSKGNSNNSLSSKSSLKLSFTNSKLLLNELTILLVIFGLYLNISKEKNYIIKSKIKKLNLSNNSPQPLNTKIKFLKL